MASVSDVVGLSAIAMLYSCLALSAVAARYPRLLADLGFDLGAGDPLFDGDDLRKALVAALVGAVGSGCAFGLATDRRHVTVALLLLHGVSLYSNALHQPSGARWASKHVVASLLALLFSLATQAARAVIRVLHWRHALKKWETGGARLSHNEAGRRVLILYANVGSGHKLAAIALRQALVARGVSGERVVLLDAMELCPKAFRYLIQTLFQELTQSLAGQHLLGFFYDAADSGRAKAKFQKRLENLCMLGLVEKMAELQPAAVLCTHFLPAQLVGTLRSTSRVIARTLPVALVLTDLDLQYMWVQGKNVDSYFVPREEAKIVMQAYGVAAQSVRVSGIPIRPCFSQVARKTRAEARRALGPLLEAPLDEADGRPVVLVMSSGKLLWSVHEALLGCSTPLVAVLCMGRQGDMRDALRSEAVPPRHRRELLGYLGDEEMALALRSADLFVGKSGGLSIAEAAALRVPMAVLDPIPGQETRNADVLLEAGACVKINDMPLLKPRIDALLADKGRLKRMGDAMGALGKAEAAFTIADAVLEERLWVEHDKEA